MPLPAAIPAIFTGLKTAAASPAGQQFLGGLATAGLNKFMNRGQSGNTIPNMDQFNQFRQNYLNDLQTNPNMSFDPIEQREMSRFRSDTMPGIQSQLLGMGGEGTGRSSGFAQATEGARADLGERLAAMRQQFNQQQEQNRLQRLGLGGQFIGSQQQYGLQRSGQIQRGQQFMNQMRQQQQQDMIKNALKAYGLTQEQIDNLMMGAQKGAPQAAFEAAIPAVTTAAGMYMGMPPIPGATPPIVR